MRLKMLIDSTAGGAGPRLSSIGHRPSKEQRSAPGLAAVNAGKLQDNVRRSGALPAALSGVSGGQVVQWPTRALRAPWLQLHVKICTRR
jgi:hypothetical protein